MCLNKVFIEGKKFINHDGCESFKEVENAGSVKGGWIKAQDGLGWIVGGRKGGRWNMEKDH